MSAAEILRRGNLRFDEELILPNESFELHVPASYRPDVPHGLFVWISANPAGAIPRPDWCTVLQSRHLLWAGPNRVGNDRDVAVRVALALHAVSTVAARFTVDSKRVYVGGFSGGAKSALRALLMYPDVFQGGVFVVGAEYYRDVPAPSLGGRRFWPAHFPVPLYAETAKSRRYAIVTGSSDFNRSQIFDVSAAMRADAFSKLLVIDLPRMGHAVPDRDAFDRAIAFADGRD